MKKSFTLIELLVATTIFIIASTIMIATTASAFSNRSKINTISAVQKNAQRIIQVLTNEVEQANVCSYYPEFSPTDAYYGILGVGTTMISQSIDHNLGRVKKVYYLDTTNGNFNVDATIYDQGTTYTKTINDPDVRVESISFNVNADSEPPENRDCTSPTALQIGRIIQNSINVEFTLSGKFREQKGYYRLHINKYVSGKSLEFTTGN